MNFFSRILTLLVTATLLTANCGATTQELLTRLSPPKGDATKTLVIYSETRAAYSLADDLAALKLQLRRVNTQIETVSAQKVDTAQLQTADHLVIFCPQPFPTLPEPLLTALGTTIQPLLWVGYGAEQLSHQPNFEGAYQVSPFAAEKPITQVTHLGRTLNANLPIWLPAQLNSTNHATTLTSTTLTNGETTATHTLSWKLGPATFFAALPSGDGAALLGDLILDFYGITQVPPSGVAVRIDGYHCHQDHQEFRHLVDYLHEAGIPFIVGVVPAYWNPETKKVEDLDSQPEFAAALRYAQRNGGRLLLQGYVNTRKAATGQEPEFWDASLDRPLADDSTEYVRERLQQGLRQMLRRELFPLGWMTPFNAASRADYAEIARHFSTAVERVQLSDATGLEKFTATAVTEDDHGRRIIPENLGPITGKRPALDALQARAEFQTQLRGTISTLSFPAYLTDDKLQQAVRLLDQLKAPFMDIADGDHWVQLPETVLLTGHAQRTINVKKNTRIGWKAYDRAGKLLAEQPPTGPAESDTPLLLQRRGQGDYELFQIIEANP